MSNNGIPPLNDWQADNYPVIYDEGAETSYYVKTGSKIEIPSGGSSYLVYSAYLSQSGTDAPVAAVLENTIGAIVWTRVSVGRYAGTLAGAFTLDKTVMPGFNYNGNLMNLVYLNSPGDHYYSWSIAPTTNLVELFVVTNPGDVLAEFSTAFGSSSLFVEIRVYP